jgi:hypothetical protein
MFKRMMENFGPEAVKVVVDNLIEAMHSRPHDFEIGEHFMQDKKTNYKYKISYNFGISSPFEMEFGFWQGRRFKRTLDGLKAYQHNEKLSEVKV